MQPFFNNVGHWKQLEGCSVSRIFNIAENLINECNLFREEIESIWFLFLIQLAMC